MNTNRCSFLSSFRSHFSRALTIEDDIRDVSNLICSFIRRIDYGKDVEQELKFCVEARGSFGSLDSVTIALIQVNECWWKPFRHWLTVPFYRKSIVWLFRRIELSMGFIRVWRHRSFEPVWRFVTSQFHR